MYGRFFSLTAVLNTSSFNFGHSRYNIEKISMYKFYSHNYIANSLQMIGCIFMHTGPV